MNRNFADVANENFDEKFEKLINTSQTTIRYDRFDRIRLNFAAQQQHDQELQFSR